MMKDNLPLLGQPCHRFYSTMARALLDTDHRLYQLELIAWRSERKSKGKRAKRIVARINSR
jgi:hypothetical protein